VGHREQADQYRDLRRHKRQVVASTGPGDRHREGQRASEALLRDGRGAAGRREARHGGEGEGKEAADSSSTHRGGADAEEEKVKGKRKGVVAERLRGVKSGRPQFFSFGDFRAGRGPPRRERTKEDENEKFGLFPPSFCKRSVTARYKRVISSCRRTSSAWATLQRSLCPEDLFPFPPHPPSFGKRRSQTSCSCCRAPVACSPTRCRRP